MNPNSKVDAHWLQFILDSADLTIISTDTEGVILSCNQGALKRLGYKEGELIGKTPEVIHDLNEVIYKAAILSEELGRTIEPGFEVFVANARLGIADENEWTYIRKDGTRFPISLSVTSIYDDRGHLEGFLGIGRDISLRKAMERKIEIQQIELLNANKELLEANEALSKVTQTDPLTQLLNRRGFHTCFEQELERMKRTPVALSIALLDLDHFKRYNDSYGHLEGDNLLRNLSEVLLKHSRTTDCVARFGGEEFLVILPSADYDLSMHIAERYLHLIEVMPDENCKVTASIGVATLSPGEDLSNASKLFDHLIGEADQAMYKSKTRGRNQVAHFSDLKKSDD